MDCYCALRFALDRREEYFNRSRCATALHLSYDIYSRHLSSEIDHWCRYRMDPDTNRRGWHSV